MKSTDFGRLFEFQVFGDEEGSLVALESSKNIPFEIQRSYHIFGIMPGARRGFHAHKTLKQLAVCVRGTCKFLLDNGSEKKEVSLSNPRQGVLIDPMVWHEMFDFSPDAVLLVLADQHYDESDYIRNYDQFMKAAQERL